MLVGIEAIFKNKILNKNKFIYTSGSIEFCNNAFTF